MNTAYNVLVIGLGCLLAIYLILSIVVTVMILRFVVALRAIVNKGEHLIDSAEEIGETLRRNAGAVGIARVLLSFMNNVSSNKRRKD